MKKNHLSIALGLIVTAFFLAMAARNVPLKELGAVLSRAKWWWIFPMFLVSLGDLAIRALRWQALLSHVKRAPFGLMLRLQAIGLAVNNVLFMRLGEVARGVLGSRELELPAATVLASVVVERALDVAALLSIFILSAFLSPTLVSSRVRLAAVAVLSGALAALAALVAAESQLQPGGAWEKRLRPWPRVHELIAHLALGAQALRRPAVAFRIVLLSLGLWLVDALVYWAAAFALGLESAINYQRSILILSWGGAGSALPAAPGAIGTFEAMVKSIVQDMGASAEQALGFAVFSHMVSYLGVTVLGMIFLYRVGLSLSHVRKALERK